MFIPRKHNLTFFIFAVFINCFKPPSWETNVTIPLVSQRFNITDFLDSTYFRSYGDTLLNFNFSECFDSIYPLDSIRINNRRDSFEIRLSDFTITNLDNVYLRLTAQEFIGAILPESTAHIPIPSFNTILNKSVWFRNLGYLSIERAILRISVSNQTRVVIDTLNCFLNGVGILSYFLLDSMASFENTIPIESIDLDSNLTFIVNITGRGTGTDSIPISANDSLLFSITLDSVKVNYGSFRSIPPRLVEIRKQKIFPLPATYQVQLREVIFCEGNLSLTLLNNFPFGCSIAIYITELDLDTALFITELSELNLLYELVNLNYHNESLLQAPLSLNYAVKFPLDTNYIIVHPGCFLRLNYYLENVNIDSLSAVMLDTLKAQISFDTTGIRISEFLGNIYFRNVFIDLEITNAIAITSHLFLELKAQNDLGDSIIIDTCLLALPGNPLIPSTTFLRLDCAALFNLHPTTFIIIGKFYLAGDVILGRHSYLASLWAINLPLAIVLTVDTITVDSIRIIIPTEIQNKVIADLDSANFYAHLKNHLPINLDAKIVLENTTGKHITIPINIPSGVINNSGAVYQANNVDIKIPLTPSGIQVFNDSLVYFSVIFYLPQTDTILLTPRDFIEIANSYAVFSILTSHLR
jgi:hypothetical protein